MAHMNLEMQTRRLKLSTELLALQLLLLKLLLYQRLAPRFIGLKGDPSIVSRPQPTTASGGWSVEFTGNQFRPYWKLAGGFTI